MSDPWYNPCGNGAPKNPTPEQKQIIADGICIQSLVVGMGTIVLSYSYLLYVGELGILTLSGPPILGAVLSLMTIVSMCVVGLGFETCSEMVIESIQRMVKKVFKAFVCAFLKSPLFSWMSFFTNLFIKCDEE